MHQLPGRVSQRDDVCSHRTGYRGQSRSGAAHADRRAGGRKGFDALDFDLVRSDKPDTATNAEASAYLRVTAKGQDPAKVDRAFSNAVVEMVLANYPGFYCTTPPQEATPYGVYWPALVPASVPEHKVVLSDGTIVDIPPTQAAGDTIAVVPDLHNKSARGCGPWHGYKAAAIGHDLRGTFR